MSTAIAACCGSIGADPARLYQCPQCFKIWRGDRRLTSVRRIIDACWPQKPCQCGATSYTTHAAGCPVFERILNAQDRGKEVESLFTEYVKTGSLRIPAGESRKDSAALVKKLCAWFNEQEFTEVACQVIVGGADHGGVADFVFDDHVFELKCVYDIDDTHIMQCAGYASLLETNGSVLHVTERYQNVREHELLGQDYHDWNTMLAHWRMLQRRAG